MSRTSTRTSRPGTFRVRSACILVVLVLTASSSPVGNSLAAADDEPLASIESHLRKAIRQTAPSIVAIDCGTEKGTGCFVSPDGDLVTAAHVVSAHRSQAIRVRLSDGSVLPANVVRLDREQDLAVLRITRPDDNAEAPTIRPIALAESVPRPGTIVFAAGFPGWLPDDDQKPTLRLGPVLAVHNSLLRTGCTLTTGDSGGPVLDLNGHLVGVNLQIGGRTEDNLHRVIPLVIKSLREAGVAFHQETDTYSVSDRQLADAGVPKIQQAIIARRVELISKSTGGASVPSAAEIVGTLWDADTVISKLSLLTDTHYQCRTAAGGNTTARLVHSDRSSDLAVLQLTDSANVPEPPLPADVSAEASIGPQTITLGRLVCSGADNWGIVSSLRHHEPSARAVLGISLKSTKSPLIIDSVEKDASAERAGLKAGDQIVSVDNRDERTSVLQQLSSTLRSMEPGDRLTISVLRGGQQMSFLLQTDGSANDLLNRDRFLDGRAGRLSLRRTGFDGMIRHDATLVPAECGGPLVDVTGALVGMNVARVSRESMLAIPVRTIRRVLAGKTAEQDRIH